MPLRRPTLAHVPALDGLRGLAVLAVVAYHAGLAGARGGYLGVSAFFTLSGFLITSLLVVEWDATGRISLTGFWSRRFRRLLPAAVAVIGGVVVASIFLADSGQLADLRGDVVAGLGYVANWRFVLDERSYAELFTGPSPLQHLWSLAIEEQFYVVFPLITLALLRVGRGRRWVLGLAYGGLLVASVAWAHHLSQTVSGASRAYYDTGARAAEVLAGALLAVVVAGRVERLDRHRRVLAGAGVMATAAIAVAWATVPQDSRWLPGGGFTLHALAVVVVLLAAHVPGPVRSLCSGATLRLLGRVSYGVYLVHWPVFVWVDAERAGVDGPALLGLRLAIVAALTAASYHFVEQPIRRRTAPIGIRGVAVGFASVAVVVWATIAVGTWAQPDDGVLVALDELRPADIVPVRTDGVVPVPADAPVPFSASEVRTMAEGPEDRPEPTPATAAAPATSTPTTTAAPADPLDQVLLVGDSVMSQAHEQLQAGFARAGIAIAYAGGPGTGPLYPQGHWAEQVRAWVEALNPDVVVIEACCNYTIEPPQRYVDLTGAALPPGSTGVLTAWEHEMRAIIDLAGARGARVVLVRFAPVQTNGFYGEIERHVDAVNALYDRLVQEDPRLELLDWGRVLAPDGRFTWDVPGLDGQPVRVRLEDGVHLTPAGSDRVAQATVAHVVGRSEP